MSEKTYTVYYVDPSTMLLQRSAYGAVSVEFDVAQYYCVACWYSKEDPDDSSMVPIIIEDAEPTLGKEEIEKRVIASLSKWVVYRASRLVQDMADARQRLTNLHTRLISLPYLEDAMNDIYLKLHSLQPELPTSIEFSKWRIDLHML
jgi:hypothetical protein